MTDPPVFSSAWWVWVCVSCLILVCEPCSLLVAVHTAVTQGFYRERCWPCGHEAEGCAGVSIFVLGRHIGVLFDHRRCERLMQTTIQVKMDSLLLFLLHSEVLLQGGVTAAVVAAGSFPG